MNDTKTTTHHEPFRYVSGVLATPADRERTGIAKLEIVRRPYHEPDESEWVALLSVLFDDAPPTAEPQVVMVATDWSKAADLLIATWPRVELTSPGRFNAVRRGLQSAQRQKAVAQ